MTHTPSITILSPGMVPLNSLYEDAEIGLDIIEEDPDSKLRTEILKTTVLALTDPTTTPREKLALSAHIKALYPTIYRDESSVENALDLLVRKLSPVAGIVDMTTAMHSLTTTIETLWGELHGTILYRDSKSSDYETLEYLSLTPPTLSLDGPIGHKKFPLRHPILSLYDALYTGDSVRSRADLSALTTNTLRDVIYRYNPYLLPTHPLSFYHRSVLLQSLQDYGKALNQIDQQ